MLTLKEWSMRITVRGSLIAEGIVSGHDRFSDGSKIHTSKVVKVNSVDESDTYDVETQSGSHYTLNIGDIEKAARDRTLTLINHVYTGG